jgi:hypothetical protein
MLPKSLSIRLFPLLVALPTTLPAALPDCPHMCEVLVVTTSPSLQCCFQLDSNPSSAPVNGSSDLPCSTANTCKSCKAPTTLSLDATSCSSYNATYIYTRGASSIMGSGSVTIDITLERRCGGLPDTATLRGEAKDPVTGHLDCIDSISVTLTCGC